MPVTMQQVLSEIDREEPDYPAFARLGPDALPHLKAIVTADDPLRAAKAAYAATVIGGTPSVEVVRAAADHHDPQVRIAAAHGMQNLGAVAPTDLVMKVLQDPDAGVRKLAIRTAGALNRTEFTQRLTEISRTDPAEHLRGPATGAIGRVPTTTAPAKSIGPR